MILTNLKVLAERGVSVQIRIPLIGGVNADAGSVEAMAEFVAGLSGEKKEVSLLPFHDVARGKDMKLGQERDLDHLCEPGQDCVEQAISIFRRYGLVANVGG
jgi:pyruvate formate lyase activating enzyme